MFKRHTIIICKGLRIFSFKKGPYKMFVMSWDLADTKNNENTCVGELKNNTEEVSCGIFNDFNSDKGDLLSENESEDDIWSQTGQLHVIMTIRRPSSPEKGLKVLDNKWSNKCDKETKMPLTKPL